MLANGVSCKSARVLTLKAKLEGLETKSMDIILLKKQSITEI